MKNIITLAIATLISTAGFSQIKLNLTEKNLKDMKTVGSKALEEKEKRKAKKSETPVANNNTTPVVATTNNNISNNTNVASANNNTINTTATTSTVSEPLTIANSSRTIPETVSLPSTKVSFVRHDLPADWGCDIVATADFDGDKDKDFISFHYNKGLSCMINNGAGKYVTYVMQPKNGSGVDKARPFDLDKDGDMDIVIYDGFVMSVYFNQGNGSKWDKVILGERFSRSFTAIDMDGDNDLDIVTAGSGIQLIENKGAGKWAEPIYICKGFQFRSVGAGDFDGDKDIDLCLASGENGVQFIFNKGGVWALEGAVSKRFESSNSLPDNMEVKDLDNDGDLDVFAAAFAGHEFTTYINEDGKGTFTFQMLGTKSSNRPENAEHVDLEGDGDLDLVYSQSTRYTNGIEWKENGSGNFNTAHMIVGTKETPTESMSYLGVIDFDNDGDLDVLSTTTDGTGFLTTIGTWWENKLK